MNNGEDREAQQSDAGESAQGPSLVFLYTLVALALAVAIGLAALIVLPFYRRT